AVLPAVGVEQGQLDGAPGRVALDAPVVTWHVGRLELFAQLDRGSEVRTGRELRRQVAPYEQVDGRVDRLAGDVVARHALAVADGAVVEGADDDEVVGVLAAVPGVADGPPQADPDAPGGQSRALPPL